MDILKEYLEDYSTTLKLVVYYHLGGMNYFTGQTERRGYYLSCTPVNISKAKTSDGIAYQTESYTAFTGLKFLLLEVKRSSAKSQTTALALVNDKRAELISQVVAKNRLVLKSVLCNDDKQ